MNKPASQKSKSIGMALVDRRPILRAMFNPQAIALIGATEAPDSVGRTLMENLLSSGRPLYPINLKRNSVLGVKAFPKIRDVPAAVDLAIIATPAVTVPDVIGECAAAGVPGAVIISAGFRETGSAGRELEKAILARRGAMRLIGPNCLGVMIPSAGLNATFAKEMAAPGNVAFISQSGALGTAILDWSLSERVGFSAFLSTGSMLDVGWGDLIFYLADDPSTRSILIYMESIGDARSFLSAAREVALRKPIIIIKAGTTQAAAKAVASHTGTLTGNDSVLNAAFSRAGVLRVNTIADLFNMAEVLSKQPRPKGPRLAVITNAGGPGVLAIDMLVTEGGEIAQLSEESSRKLNEFLPSHWSRSNPVDLLGDATVDRFVKAVEIVSADSSNDGILVILTPQAMTDATAIAEGLSASNKIPGKPILASWMGASAVTQGEAILNASAIPTFEYPDTAARSFCHMWRYSDNLRALYETPALTAGPTDNARGRASAAAIIKAAQRVGRTLLTEVESKQILDAYGIPTVPVRIARSEDEAVRIAAEVGPLVVLKLYSEIITHKTDVGGVKLNLREEDQIRQAYQQIEKSVADKRDAFLGVTVERMIQSNGYELILGSSVDSQFGPVILFGSGGQLVEVVKDYALGFPPLNCTLARRIMEQTRIYNALKGVRGRAAVDLAGLERLLVRFSLLVAEQRWIKEIDINPLLVSTTQMLALDARIVLHNPEIGEENLPRLAIRPYPQQYVSAWKLKDGSPIVVRPIRPEDEPMMVKFHGTLSENSVHFRYFGLLKLEQRVAHDRLVRMCFNDYDREIAIIAVRNEPKTKEDEIIGVGRLIKVHGVNDAEFAIVLSDQWQGHGLGSHFLKLLLEIGRQEGSEHVIGQMLPDNYAMQRICKKLGFAMSYDRLGEVVEAKIKL
ncbi:MAG TPA: bifunctional acetate--CoA ligase family protein/GNAT family N-acetyltransferase [Chthoniobacterales bacterium]|nr:bifunctional acetate--CoA ligase family protein/GNAT family N-acetyltransferase [Chthoniobacterales bacterium]